MTLINIVKAIQGTKEQLRQIAFKADKFQVVLRLNNTRQYVSITDGVTTNAAYGKIDMRGFPLYKANTPQAIKDKLEELNKNSKLSSKVTAVPCVACSICGKPLTDPKSIEAGIGPECAMNSDLVDNMEE